MNPRTLTSAEETERAELRHLVNKFEVWRNGRNSYRTEEVPAHLAHLDNTKRSRLEVLDFIADPPAKYFAYIATHENGDPKYVTTFTGESLAVISWQYYAHKIPTFGRPSERITFGCVGINGLKYSGTYYKSSGSYCRLRLLKDQT